jgi:hypothetical protein
VQRLGEWLLAKDIHAAIIALVCTLLPLIGLPGDFCVSIVVALITLRKGPLSGLFVLAWVALPAIALMYWHDLGTFDVLLARSAVVWLMAAILHKTASWKLVLYALAAVGVLVVIGFHSVIGDVGLWWSKRISSLLMEVLKEAPLQAQEVQSVTQRIASIATGLVMFVSSLVLFLQLLIARYWQASLFNPRGLRKEALNLRVGPLMTMLLLAALIGSLMHIGLFIDCLPVLILPFLVAGMSLLHMMVHHKDSGRFALVFLYVVAFFMPYVLLLVALIGAADSWLDFRVRYQLALKH